MFKPNETVEIEVTNYEKFKVKVVRYFEIEEIEEDKNSIQNEDGNKLESILSELNVSSLKELAKFLGMEGYSKLNKKDLITDIIADNEEEDIIEFVPKDKE